MIAFLHGHRWLFRRRLDQQDFRNEKPSGIIKTSTIIMKRVSWFCFASFFCESVGFANDAIDNKETLLATRHVSTEAKRKIPTTHFATDSQTEDLESRCFSLWIFAVCLTVYSMFWEVSAVWDRSEALIVLLPTKAAPSGIDFTEQSFFCVVSRLQNILGKAGSEPANGGGWSGCREIWAFNRFQFNRHFNSMFGACGAISWLTDSGFFRKLPTAFSSEPGDTTWSVFRGCKQFYVNEEGIGQSTAPAFSPPRFRDELSWK